MAKKVIKEQESVAVELTTSEVSELSETQVEAMVEQTQENFGAPALIVEDLEKRLLSKLSEATGAALIARQAKSTTGHYMAHDGMLRGFVTKYLSVGIANDNQIDEAIDMLAADLEAIQDKFGIIGNLVSCSTLELSVTTVSSLPRVVFTFVQIPADQDASFELAAYALKTNSKEGQIAYSLSR